ncbi:MAG: hypothetical protein U0587_05330 [Candidatus Binatia bacterium]
MPEATAPEALAQAKRVLGMFVAMLGSGIVLESAAVWTGLGITVAGLGLMIWGLAATTRESAGDAAATRRASESAP